MNNPLRMNAEVLGPETEKVPDRPGTLLAFVAYLVIAGNGIAYSLYGILKIWLYIHFNTTRALGLAFVNRGMNDSLLGCIAGLVITCFALSYAMDILAARKAAHLAQKMLIRKLLAKHEQLDHMHPKMRDRFEQTALEKRRAV